VQVELAKSVAAEPATAFETVADILDWPQIIRSIQSIELLTPGPIRPGTRLREQRILFGRTATQELEVANIQRPHRLRLAAEHPDLHYELDHLIDAILGGCRVMLVFRSRPMTRAGRAIQPFMRPLIGIELRDELEQDLADLASAITAKSSGNQHSDHGFSGY